jgi:phosphatidylserine/phosphatidylglycerophosphate/cardiolipin synthase-like enzyme
VTELAIAPRGVLPSFTEGAERSRVEWLIDNSAAYEAVLSAIGRAQRSIWISQLAFDPDCAVHRSAAPGVARPADDPRLLLDALVAAARRGVRVVVLLNASLLLDTAKSLRRAIAERGARGIEVRGISRFPQLLHAKMLIVDEEEAILLGSPFVNGYWDDTRHRPDDLRRPARELGGRPLHDVSVRLTGPAVRQIGVIFAELWNEVSVGAGAASAVRPLARPASVVDDRIAIVRTSPHRTLRGAAHGHTGILAATESGIDGARSLIYIEHQYLSARPVVAALVRALHRAPALEIVIVLNQNPDVTAYRGWQNLLLREAGLLMHPRVGIFALWSAERSTTHRRRRAINQVFVHSKVLTVDDRWATTGSANLDGVSLHSYGDDFSSRIGRRVFRDVRNFDVNVVVCGARSAPSPAVRDLRSRLWRGHLGDGSGGVEAPPVGGWVAHWRSCAARNVAALNRQRGDPLADALGTSFVLPYSTMATPAEQLADVGIQPHAVDLRFDPGWLEIHCSPNWVRNMFT